MGCRTRREHDEAVLRPALPVPNPSGSRDSGSATPRRRVGRVTIDLRTPLIPRDVLYGNPDRADVQLSPDGRHLSYLAPVDGVLNVWVAPVAELAAATPVTADRRRGIRAHDWAFSSTHILYPQDVGGDEDWHVYSVEVATGRTVDLTPFEHVSAAVLKLSRDLPGEVLVGVNDRVPELHDAYRVDIATGERTLVLENPGFADVTARDDFTIPLAIVMTPDGGATVLRSTGGEFEPFFTIPMEDTLTSHPIGFTKDGEHFYAVDSRGRDKAVLTRVSLTDGSGEVIYASDLSDIHAIMTHPTEKAVEAVAVNYLRTEWVALDETVGEHLQTLAAVADGEVSVVSRTTDDQDWIVAFVLDDGPVRYYHYRVADRHAEFLFANRDDLDQYQLAKQGPVEIPARDGLRLVSYLTLPVGTDAGDGVPTEPLPMVLDVHGGPWARDAWGFNPEHQLLANRGYAVLAVNYRGSTGFGKEFLNAGNLQWGATMHDDLLDAVQWAVDRRIADPDRIAIHGGSYGGYAALAGLALTPDVFTCGVDIVGPSNLITLLESIPPYWAPMVQMFKDRVGDFTTEEGREFLLSRSPLTYADRIERPLLIGQGANDPRVKIAESEQIVAAMRRHGIPVTYVLFPDEGHGFAEPANRLTFFAVTEAFLAAHLGGRAEPFGSVTEGSSITIPVGADGLPGIPAVPTASP